MAAGVRVKTTFAPVFLHDVGNLVDIQNQNGSVSIDSIHTTPRHPCADLLVRTSFAPIEVTIPAGGYNVKAQTSFGSIESDVPVTVSRSMGRETLNGTIGSGGCRLELSDNNGNIRIRKQ